MNGFRFKNFRAVLLAIALVLTGFGQSMSASEFLESNCQDRVTKSQDDVSRSYLYLDFSHLEGACTVTGTVGGEHISNVRVIGNKGDVFRIGFAPLNGHPMHGISGGDVRRLDQKGGKTQVTIEKEAGFFEISLSAHPHGDFSLIIEKKWASPWGGPF